MITFFKEWEAYTESEISKELQLETGGFETFKKVMRESKILEQNENLTYSFKFVGLLEYNQRFVFFLPKYFSGGGSHAELKQLVKLFLEYSKRENLDEDEIETLGNMEDENQFNFLSVVDFLLTDYVENGLYENEKRIYELNGEGEINWFITVEEQEAYLRKGRPVYMDVVTEYQFRDEDDLIRQIHKSVLSQCSLYMEQLAFLDDFQYAAVDYDLTLEELGSTEHLVYVIENELHQQFNDRKQRVLRALNYFLTQEKGMKAEEQLRLFGTRAFHVVWEKVCAYILGNEYEQYKDDIPKPVWTDFRTEEENETETLKPDILKKISRLRSFFIVDAKYYTTSFNARGRLTNNSPGIGDVIKQYMYEKALKTSLGLEGYSWYNLFLLPTERMDELFGKVALPFLAEQKPIFLMRIQAPNAYSMYIQQKVYSVDFYLNVRDEIDKKSGELEEVAH
jgi:hypothetical protein